MPPFVSYDELRLFIIVSQHQSFTAASKKLNLTKGAVSYQIKQLEKDCGFKLFHRLHNRIALTKKGKQLLPVVQSAFQEIEDTVNHLREAEPPTITIGASTYFALHWLTSRLMSFMSAYPRVRLRLQPVIGLGNLETDQLDMMIRWGKGDWLDAQTEVLFLCPAIATAGAATFKAIQKHGLDAVLPTLTLLHDREGSPVWKEWFNAAGYPYRSKRDPLVIPDPNVRVEAVISEQGIALNDRLIQSEIDRGRLFQISPEQLDTYGYHLVYSDSAINNEALQAFRNWICSQATPV